MATERGNGKPTKLHERLTKVSETENTDDTPTLQIDGSNYGAWKARMTVLLKSERYGLLYKITANEVSRKFDGTYTESLSKYFPEFEKVDSDSSSNAETVKLSFPSETSSTSSIHFGQVKNEASSGSSKVFSFGAPKSNTTSTSEKSEASAKEDMLFETAIAEATAQLHRALNDKMIHKMGLQTQAPEIWSSLERAFKDQANYQDLYFNSLLNAFNTTVETKK